MAHASATISVAMCTYNGARWVGQQLQSIIEQMMPPAQIVICDDGSTDGTAAVVADIARTSRVPIEWRVNETNLGISRNFQRAISLCTGDYIALSDQDDFWHPRKLQVLAEALEQRPDAAYAFCDARLVDAQLRPMGFGLWDIHQLTPDRQRIIESEDSMELLTVMNFATGATMLIRRDAVLKTLPVSPNWIHDGWISLMLSAFSRCVLVSEQLVDYRQHPSQQVGACRREMLKELKWQRAMDRNFFSREAPRWADAYAFLRQRMSLMRRPGDIELVRRRAMLDHDRLELRQSPEARWDLVARHWQAGDYSRYAWGPISAAVDLLIHE